VAIGDDGVGGKFANHLLFEEKQKQVAKLASLLCFAFSSLSSSCLLPSLLYYQFVKSLTIILQL
jgi:hypothetical protein